MSTAYHHFKAPFTSIRLETGIRHDRVSVWESHGLAGVLTVNAGVGRTLVLLFAEEEAVMTSYFGGKMVGCIVVGPGCKLPPETPVISERGEVLTVGEVLAFAGRGKEAVS